MPVDLDMLLPHKLFASMYHNFRSAFNERILGGDGNKIGQLWRAMHAHPAYPVHPMHNHSRFDHMRQAVPIGLHFDGVATIGSGKSWKRMVEAASWSSHLCQRGSSWFRNYLIGLVVKVMIISEGDETTMGAFWRELVWSLYWLYQGAHADRDSKGRLYTPEDGILYTQR